jgi:hypothetical protein
MERPCNLIRSIVGFEKCFDANEANTRFWAWGSLLPPGKFREHSELIGVTFIAQHPPTGLLWHSFGYVS